MLREKENVAGKQGLREKTSKTRGLVFGVKGLGDSFNSVMVYLGKEI